MDHPIDRLLLAIGTYIVALIVCWLAMGAGFPQLSQIYAFPVGLVAITHSGGFLQWLVPTAPINTVQVIYPAFAVALTLTQHAKRFWKLYGVFVAVLILNIAGCVMSVPRGGL